MDRNSIVGIVIIAAILIGWGIMSQPTAEEIAQRRYTDSIKRIEIEKAKIAQEKKEVETAIRQDSVKQVLVESDSLEKAELKNKYGVESSVFNGEEKLLTVKSDSITVTFTNKGAQIKSIVLNGYKTFDGKPLTLIDNNSDYGIGIVKWHRNSRELYFTPSISESEISVENDSLIVSYTVTAEDNKSFSFVYTIPKTGYMVNFTIKGENSKDLFMLDELDFTWEKDIVGFEKSRKTEQQYSYLQYYFADDDEGELSPTSDDEEEITGSAKWVAFKQQFFSSVIIAKDKFSTKIKVKSHNFENGDILKRYSTDLYIPFNREVANLQFFFGPNHFPTLKKYDIGIESLVPLGWGIFGWVNRIAVIPIFNWLRGFIASYGLIILLLTLIIKAALFPLTYKSYLSTARMRVLKPEIDEINKKFPNKDQMMKRQQETMALYKKVGVSPLGGCLPMLIQFPILIAMFRFFPASIELRQKAFLWATDLSSYDSLPFLEWSTNIPLLSNFYGNHVSIFTILMAISMFFTTKLNSSSMTTAPGQPNMKVMMNLMPVMMLFFFNSYASGLSLYYFIANMVTLGQTWAIRKFVDDTAILEKLKQNKAKPKKKSRFQQRLEDMQKMQREMQKQKRK